MSAGLQALPGLPLLLAATAYASAVRRLARRGDGWPRSRSLATAAALGLLAVAVLPPLAAHDEDLRAHVVQHLLLMVAGPLLLALGAPVTLTLRSLGTPSRRRLLALLHSPPMRLLVHPLTVVALDVGGLYAVYLTPVFEASEEQWWLHALIHAHMVLAGTLLAVVVAGADPLPGRPGVPMRLALVVATGAAHDVLARLLWTRGWGDAARLLAYGGEAADVAFAVAVLSAWYAAGGRELARSARRVATS